MIPMQTSQALGRHLLIELMQCPRDILDSTKTVEKILLDTVTKINATLVSTSFHHFSPYGVSGVVVIAESHITIHTWPEHGYAAVDVFTCDHSIDYTLLEAYLTERFKAGSYSAQTINRGEQAIVAK